MVKLITLLLLISSCSHYTAEELRTVEYIDTNKYQGKWYVIENIPTMFEIGAHNATETYMFDGDNIKIDFKYNADSFDGEIKSYPQKGEVFNKDTNAHWKIKIPWIPWKFDYLVIDIAKDYSWCVVGVPSKNYVWIMARDKTIPAETLTGIRSRLKEIGYDISKLEQVPQN
ncbi:lipocalin family protein [Bacteriovorax sp. Seq25_V]|uniref:lipocalin family protein n=1 Tax=Bacteriovorax sp. Seq25_V TaxID=1201288 RepID=UPI000389FA23|nr:lipocalin family protein [Bacteriovorax sp. Seq25_V]EQC46158.1 lipocalin-like protein [Bacteriovorax sp. Seq25_V]